MSEKPVKEISVVIPTYNRAVLLSYQLESLVRQTLENDRFEVVIVDDGSTDETGEVVGRFGDRLHIRYYRQEHKGFRLSRVRNIGMSIAEGKYLVLLDTGLLLASGALERHMAVHEQSTSPCVMIGYVYGFDVPNERVEPVIRQLDSQDADGCIRFFQDQKMFDIRQYQYDLLGEKLHTWPAPFEIFWTCHVSLEKAEALKVGGFDEDYKHWGGEDTDLGIRLYLNNNAFVMDKKACSLHWPHTKAVTDVAASALESALALHRKYNLWQTRFFGVIDPAKGHQNFSINMAIQYTGPFPSRQKMEDFVDAHREQLENNEVF